MDLLLLDLLFDFCFAMMSCLSVPVLAADSDPVADPVAELAMPRAEIL